MKELAHWKREAQRALAGEDRVKAKLTRVEKEVVMHIFAFFSFFCSSDMRMHYEAAVV
jgi:hypothetical protein